TDALVPAAKLVGSQCARPSTQRLVIATPATQAAFSRIWSPTLNSGPRIGQDPRSAIRNPGPGPRVRDLESGSGTRVNSGRSGSLWIAGGQLSLPVDRLPFSFHHDECLTHLSLHWPSGYSGGVAS